MLRFLGIFCGLLLIFAPASGATLERDLGMGLRYVRVQSLPEDLPAPANKKIPTVLDLRYTHAEQPGEAALQAWLRFNAGVHTPVFILANNETGPNLVALLLHASALPGVLVVARQNKEFRPDVAVQVSPADERRAYDALAGNAPINSLVVETPEKARNDEARLAHEHLSDSALDDEATPDAHADASAAID